MKRLKIISEKLREYHFEFKHLLVILFALVFFQILVPVLQKSSLQNLLSETQEWYQRDSAERLANLTATSLELLLQTIASIDSDNTEQSAEIISKLNIILNQPLLQEGVRELCILVKYQDQIYAIDDGKLLYEYFFGDRDQIISSNNTYKNAIKIYSEIWEELKKNEQIKSLQGEDSNYRVFVPFVPKGEYVGAVYVKDVADFTFISREIISSYDETALIFAALILLGLLAMFFISSYTVKERDEAQQFLFQEQQNRMLHDMNHEKEKVFTKRIYHTHHKAEKVMGFIKEDLRSLSDQNIEMIKYRVTKYANFISRVIYDMKWYDPPVQAIRNPIFRTDLNDVIRFIIKFLFLRVSRASELYQFELNLDPQLPAVPVNEFVVWEIIEPLIQNSIDHSGTEKIKINIHTRWETENRQIRIKIQDTGPGIAEDLLQENEQGIKKIFLENISTKKDQPDSGYGCYLAYEISKHRCGWELDVKNNNDHGCEFEIKIPIA